MCRGHYGGPRSRERAREREQSVGCARRRRDRATQAAAKPSTAIDAGSGTRLRLTPSSKAIGGSPVGPPTARNVSAWLMDAAVKIIDCVIQPTTPALGTFIIVDIWLDPPNVTFH
jgi:hypothetical protein